MKKIIPLVIIVFCLIYVWHMYGNMKMNEKTAVVKSGEYTDIITTDALVIRNEQAITVGASGFFQNSVPNCSKVRRGEAVGEFYAGTPDKEIINKINAVNEKLSEAQSAAGSDELFTNDILTIESKISEYTEKISALAAEGNQVEINKLRKNIDALAERRTNIENGTKGGRESAVAALNQQKAELERTLGGNVKQLYSESSGIFVANADGLEEMLSKNAVREMSTGTIEELINRKNYEPSKDILPYPVARVADNSEWIIAFITDEGRAAQLEENGTADIKLPGSTEENTRCRYIGKSEPADGKTAVFLSGTQEIDYLYTNRRVTVEVFVDRYSGLSVPASAVKKQEGKDVVEVRSGKNIVVKSVEVLFKNEDTAIIKEDNTKENSLLLYEEVVLQ